MFFLNLAPNINYGYTLEPPHQMLVASVWPETSFFTLAAHGEKWFLVTLLGTYISFTARLKDAFLESAVEGNGRKITSRTKSS